MERNQISWTKFLDILTDTDRRHRKSTVIQRATETERLALFLLRREGWSAQISPKEQKNYHIELFKPNQKAAVQVRNQRIKVDLGQIEKFFGFLNTPNEKNITEGIFISTGVTCTRKITPKGWRESTKIRIGDSSYEKDIYRRADRRDFTRF